MSRLPDLFENDVSADEFTIAGDDQRLAGIAAAAGDDTPPPADPGPEPLVEDAPVPDEPAEEPAQTGADEDAFPPAAEAGDIEPDDLQAYLDRFGGDQEKALRAAVEAQKLIGRQGQELGELRALAQEVAARGLDGAPQPQYDVDEVSMWLADNPTRIPEVAEHAFYSGNEDIMNAAVAQWKEIDPSTASKFERWTIAQQVRAELSAESQTREQASADWNQAAATFAANHEDLDSVAPQMLTLAKQYPNIVQILRTGTPEAKTEVLDFLYTKARSQVSGDIAQTARTIAREQANEAAQAIRDATVASGATAIPAGVTNLAAAIAADWDTAEAPWSQGEDGWNV